MITGKPSYDPATFGVKALMDRIRNPDYPVRDGVAAAAELAGRNLTEEDGQALMALLNLNRDQRINVSLLNAIVAKKMAFLKPDLMTFQGQVRDAETAAACSAAISGFIQDDTELFGFIKELVLKSPYANVRARAAKVLASYEGQAADVFVEALDRETSASTALLMCETLRKVGSDPCYEMLDKIANDVAREFKADDYYGTKVTANNVRAAAVVAMEARKATTAQ
jgi:hypothetical protein